MSTPTLILNKRKNVSRGVYSDHSAQEKDRENKNNNFTNDLVLTIKVRETKTACESPNQDQMKPS